MATINLKLPYSEDLAHEYMEFIDLESMNCTERSALPISFLFKYYFEYSTNATNLLNEECFNILLHYINNGDDKKLEIIFNHILGIMFNAARHSEVRPVKSNKESNIWSRFIMCFLIKNRSEYAEKIMFKLGTLSYSEFRNVVEERDLHEIFCQEMSSFKSLISQVSNQDLKESLIKNYWREPFTLKESSLTLRDDYEEKMLFISKGVEVSSDSIKMFIKQIFNNKRKQVQTLVKMGFDPNEILDFLLTVNSHDLHEETLREIDEKEEEVILNKIIETFEILFKIGADADNFINKAFAYNDKRILISFLKNGANPNSFLKNGNRLAHECVKTGDTEKLEILGNFGANMNFLNKERNTPINNSIANDSYDTFKILLKNGANPNKNSKITISEALSKCLNQNTHYPNTGIRSRNRFAKKLNKFGFNIPLMEFVPIDMIVSSSNRNRRPHYRGSYDSYDSYDSSGYAYETKSEILKDFFVKKWL